MKNLSGFEASEKRSTWEGKKPPGGYMMVKHRYQHIRNHLIKTTLSNRLTK